jgi:PAS domain S-box-containing protein
MTADREDPANTNHSDFERGYWRSAPPVGERLGDLESGELSTDEFRLLADNIPTLCWIANGDGYIVWYNRRWHEYCGTMPEQMEGWGWQSVHDPDVLPAVMERWTRSIATGQPFEMTFPLRGADGVFRPFLTRVQPVRDGSGNIARWFGVNTEISAQAAAEAALRESEARFRAMADSAPIPAWVTNEDGIEFANRALAEYAGIEPDALRGDTWTQLVHPDDLQRVAAVRAAAWAKQEPYLFEARFRAADGEWRTLQVNSRPRFDGGSTLLGYVGMAVDLTEMRRTEAELRESEARFRDVFQNAAVGMIEIDADWNILASNEAYREITGRHEEDLRGANCLSFTHVDDVATGEKALRALAAGEVSRVAFEKRYLRPNGEITWVRSSLSRVSSQQSANRFLKVVEDITEVRSAREALREESEALEILNRTAAQVAAELDLDNLVQTVVDAGVELTGAQFGAFFYNVIEERGESYMLYALSGAPREAFSKYPMPRNTHIFAPTFSGDGTVRSDDITKDPRYGKSEPYYGMPEGHLPVRSYLAEPVVSRSGEVIGGLFFGHERVGVFTERAERLMTGLAAQAAIGIDNARLFQASQNLNQTLEQRVTEEVARRSEAEERLRQAQKMETVGQLTGGLAHDFNNLLQIVTGNLDILLRNLTADTPRLRRSAENAMRGAERASTLTQRLLAFSRRQPLSPKPIDPNKLVAGMEELLHRTLGETIAIETVLSPGLWRTEADPNQLENTILNLAVNARDAMPDGGKLTIETSNAHLDEGYVAQNAEVWAGQYVVICVSDTGVGMPEETVGRAFEPFFTTKEVGKGTGLGLSMVYGFVKQSGGHVKIYSEVGEGTTVKIYLPRLLGSHDEVEEAQDTLVPEGTREETILVCEDDDDVRAYSVEVLRELGYRVLEAHDGRAALHLIERQEERIDLLFTDVVLPGGMTGAVLAEEARKVRPELKVLFTTGYARNAIVHHGRLDPGVELITKPFSFADLAARVRDLLDARPVS